MYLEDIPVNTVIRTERFPIEQEAAFDFARKFDPLPVHLSEAAAAKTRFGKIIAPGVMVFMSVWRRYLEQDLAGEDMLCGMSTSIQWFHPVYLGDHIRGVITVTGVRYRNPYNGILELTTEAFNDDDEMVLRDITEMLVRRRPVKED